MKKTAEIDVKVGLSLFQENGLGLHGFLREKYPLLTKNLFKQLVPRSLKFLVVRHPFERVMSAYVDKLEDYERSVKVVKPREIPHNRF